MQNLADYFTKHHPASHHRSVHPTILTAVNDPEYRKLFMTQDTSPPQINVKSGGTHKEQTMKIQGIPTKTSGQFRYYWQSGTQNLADYFTKHHPATHHRNLRPTILTAVNDPEYRKLFETQNASPPQINAESGGTQRAQKKVPTKTSVTTTSFVKNSLPDTHVPKHGHSKMCLRILRQGCVRPTSTYITKGGKDSRQSYKTP